MILCAWHNSEIMLLDHNTGLNAAHLRRRARVSYNGDEQTAVTATVDLPVCAAFNNAGELIFSDQANMIIRKIDAAGLFTPSQACRLFCSMASSNTSRLHGQ